MVVRRRGALMGLVAVVSLALSVGYLWRFGDDRGIVPFLLGVALLVVAVVHGIAWRESRSALLIADMTGLQLRLAGRWTALPWSEVEAVEVARRGRIGDGHLTVRARDERRALGEGGARVRFAVLLNKWLYDAALVVPYGVTTRVSVDDIPGSLRRLADGRVAVVELDEQPAEPQATIEVSAPGTLSRPLRRTAPEAVPAPRRLAAVVSALRAQTTRHETVSIREPATVGTLALSDHLAQRTEPLPELQELRRHAPEDQPDSHSEEQTEEGTQDRGDGPAPQRAVTVVHQEAPALLEVPLVLAAAGSVPANVAIGGQVRAAREWLGISVDDLADRTRIRPYVIESIEVGDFSPCGGDFYARGHLRMLGGVLGIDSAPIIASYDANVAGAPVSPRAVFEAELTRGVVRPAGGGSRWGALVGTVLVLLLVWGAAKLLLSDPAQSSHSGQAPTSRTAALREPAITDPSIGDALPPAAPPTHLTLTATGGSSLVVVRDATMKVVYQGVLQAGQSADVKGTGPLSVMAVDGGAVSLAAPGHPEAPMGIPGQKAVQHVNPPT